MLRNIIVPKIFIPIVTLFLKIYFKDIYMKTTKQVFDDIGISNNKRLMAVICS